MYSHVPWHHRKIEFRCEKGCWRLRSCGSCWSLFIPSPLSCLESWEFQNLSYLREVSTSVYLNHVFQLNIQCGCVLHSWRAVCDKWLSSTRDRANLSTYWEISERVESVHFDDYSSWFRVLGVKTNMTLMQKTWWYFWIQKILVPSWCRKLYFFKIASRNLQICTLQMTPRQTRRKWYFGQMSNYV